MLKKIILGCAALAFATAALAQEGKPRMYINNFTFAEGVTESSGTAVYQAVVAGLNSTQRFEVATEGMESALSQEIARRSSEAAMHDDKTRNEVLMAAGCQYVLSGNVIKCDIETTVLDDGSKLYNCILSYSVTVAEVATSTTVASEKFDSNNGILTGSVSSASSPEQAIANEVGRIEKNMERFVVNNFPVEGILVASDYEVKKDKLVSCYINLGSDQGVKVGDLFVVKGPKVVLGNVTYNEIGRVKVDEIVAGSISQCKVLAGPKEIYMAIENYLALDEASQQSQPIKVQAMVRESVGNVLGKIGL